ncbi:hypothetical protein ANN_27679 [Periplaneta americana]|uniref:Mariner Mos1 transposase n=1 Tax=Periplaneta americana TaxID=6978 RepID=A0ABQ8RWM5_PERAM|nr:hypothetical protein ANN_27679 [Periplaneta americana]
MTEDEGGRGKTRFCVVMDLIKAEPDVDPLAIETNDNTDIQERKPLSEEISLWNPHIARIKVEPVDPGCYLKSEVKTEVESVDPSCYLTWDVKNEESTETTIFPVGCNDQEELHDVDGVKCSLKLEVTTEEDERVPGGTDGMLNNEPSQVTSPVEVAECQNNEENSDDRVSSQATSSENLSTCQNYDNMIANKNKPNTCRGNSDDPAWRTTQFNSLLPCWMLITDGLRTFWATAKIQGVGYPMKYPRFNNGTTMQSHRPCWTGAKGKMTTLLDESSLWTKPGLAHTNQPNLKRQSNEWKHPGSSRPKKVRPTQSAVKVMFIVACDIDGVILHHAVSPRQTANADYYCRFLQHHLRPALRRKRRHLVVQNPIILHDNARSDTAAAVKALLRRWQWEILEHPPYSPDISPCDYDLLTKGGQYGTSTKMDALMVYDAFQTFGKR